MGEQQSTPRRDENLTVLIPMTIKADFNKLDTFPKPLIDVRKTYDSSSCR